MTDKHVPTAFLEVMLGLRSRDEYTASIMRGDIDNQDPNYTASLVRKVANTATTLPPGQ